MLYKHAHGALVNTAVRARGLLVEKCPDFRLLAALQGKFHVHRPQAPQHFVGHGPKAQHTVAGQRLVRFDHLSPQASLQLFELADLYVLPRRQKAISASPRI